MTREDWRVAPAALFLFILPFTHTVALRLLSLFAAFVIAVWLWWRLDRGTVQLPSPLWQWIAFWAVLPIALLPFSIDWRYSLGEIKTEIVYGLLALFSLLVLVRSRPSLRIVLAALVASYVVMSIWAIVSYVDLGRWEDASRFGGTGTFTTYLLTALPVTVLAYELRLFGNRTRELVVLLLAVGLIAATLTAQRTVFVGLLAQFLVLVVSFRKTGAWPISRAGLGASIALALSAGLAVLLAGIARRFGPETSVLSLIAEDPRINNWGHVLVWIDDRWTTGYGYGIGTMKRAFPEMWGRSDLFWHAHNVFLNYAFQLGILGLLAVIGVFVLLARHWSRQAVGEDSFLRAIGTTGLLMIVGVLVRNSTNDFFQRDLSLLFWGITGMLIGAASMRRRELAGAA